MSLNDERRPGVTNTTHRQPCTDARAVLKGTLLLAGGLLLAARGERR